MSSNSKGAIPKDKSNLSNNSHKKSKNNLSDKALNRSIDSAKLTVYSSEEVLEMKKSQDNETIIKEKSSKKSNQESSRETFSGYVLEAKPKYPRLPPKSNDHVLVSPLTNAILSYENVLSSPKDVEVVFKSSRVNDPSMSILYVNSNSCNKFDNLK